MIKREDLIREVTAHWSEFSGAKFAYKGWTYYGFTLCDCEPAFCMRNNGDGSGEVEMCLDDCSMDELRTFLARVI